MTMELRPWFEANRELLEWELQQLRGVGFEPEIDEAERALGRLAVRGSVATVDGDRRLLLVFPDTYPDHRVEVYGETGDEALALHQDPFTGKLCLLENYPEAWLPNEDSAAFLVERVRGLRQANEKGREGLEEIGIGAPEPWSSYFPYELESLVLILDRVADAAKTESGAFELRLEGESELRGLVSKVFESSGKGSTVSAEAPAELMSLFRGQTLPGRWFRLGTPPPVRNAGDTVRWAIDQVPTFANWLKGSAPIRLSKGKFHLFAFVYEEETPDGHRDAWLTSLIQRSGGQSGTAYLLRPFIWVLGEQQLRIQSVADIRGSRVAIVGLGTLGAPMALELAKTGLLGELRLIDSDHFSIWNLVRHPLNVRSLGRQKVAALAEQAKLADPLLKVTGQMRKIGDALPPQGHLNKEPPIDLALARGLEGFDLVVDATADCGVSSFLSRVSLAFGFPMVVVSVTDGAWGGEIVRTVPGSTGCYDCYRFWGADGAMPVPNQDEGAKPIYTRGCGFPSFAGTGFDALSVASDAVRLCVQTILRSREGQYPDTDYDVLVRNNRGNSVGAGVPSYSYAKLPRHPKCPWH